MIASATCPLKIVGFADPSHRFAAGPSLLRAEGGYGFLKDMSLQLF
jgi:hypothetical protein